VLPCPTVLDLVHLDHLDHDKQVGVDTCVSETEKNDVSRDDGGCRGGRDDCVSESVSERVSECVNGGVCDCVNVNDCVMCSSCVDYGFGFDCGSECVI
jgi:hypothetical protein